MALIVVRLILFWKFINMVNLVQGQRSEVDIVDSFAEFLKLKGDLD